MRTRAVSAGRDTALLRISVGGGPGRRGCARQAGGRARAGLRVLRWSARGPRGSGPRPAPGGVVVRVGGQRHLPQRLARLAGPRPGRRPAARPRARAGRHGRGGRRGRAPLVGRRPGHRAVRLRLRRVRPVRGRRPPGLRPARPSRASRTGARWPSSSPSTRPTSTWSPLPEELVLATAAALGCRYATAFRAVVQIGAGAARGVGGGARLRRGRTVGGADRRGRRGPGRRGRRLARRAGARPRPRRRAHGRRRPFDVPPPSPTLTGGGAHVSLDALGARGHLRDSVRSLRPRGRHVQVGLLPPAQGRPEVPMERVIALELQLLGSHGMAAHAYPELLGLIAAGRLDPRRLVTRELALDDAAAALVDVGRTPGDRRRHVVLTGALRRPDAPPAWPGRRPLPGRGTARAGRAGTAGTADCRSRAPPWRRCRTGRGTPSGPPGPRPAK